MPGLCQPWRQTLSAVNPGDELFSSVSHTGRSIFKCHPHGANYFQVSATQGGLFSSVSHTGRTIFKCQPPGRVTILEYIYVFVTLSFFP